MSVSAANHGNALVISYSEIASDPRVRRQIDWLCAAGWTVDTLGLGDHPTSQVQEHFVLAQPKAWVTSRLGLAIAHTFLSNPALFRGLMSSRIPETVRMKIQQGHYGFFLFNEVELAPWADWVKRESAKSNPRIHLDIHEYRQSDQRWNTLGGKITGSQYRWVRNAIGSPAFDTRTVVCEPIGQIYADEFGFTLPQTVRNIPPYVEQSASPVDPKNFRMLFHGLPSFGRGFAEILDAMQKLPDQFTMTFMLMPNEEVHSWLRNQIAKHPAKDRIHIVEPAPMRQIAEWINEYDLEIVFYRPTSQNLEFALPNKFFESIQGRLALVVAEGKTMAPIVREWRNGIVVDGYEGSDLADALSKLTHSELVRMKSASNEAAQSLNAKAEGERFIRAALGGYNPDSANEDQ